MQAQSEGFVKMGLVSAFVDIAKKEGVAGLWRVNYLHYLLCD